MICIFVLFMVSCWIFIKHFVNFFFAIQCADLQVFLFVYVSY